MHITMETAVRKQLLEPFLSLIKICTGFTIDIIWMNTKARRALHKDVRSRASKSYLKAELCFHRYVHFACIPIYVFSFSPQAVC